MNEFQCIDWRGHARPDIPFCREFAKQRMFWDKFTLQHQLELWHIENSRECYIAKYKITRFKCSNISVCVCLCSLRVCQKQLGSWEITKDVFPHSCTNIKAIKKHRSLDVALIVNLVYPCVFNNISIIVCDLQEVVINKFTQAKSCRKVWYAKQNVVTEMFRAQESVFQRLSHLMVALCQSNPRTVFDYEWKAAYLESDPVFGKWFWFSGPSIQGFSHCIPLIIIDATYLYRKVYMSTINYCCLRR